MFTEGVNLMVKKAVKKVKRLKVSRSSRKVSSRIPEVPAGGGDVIRVERAVEGDVIYSSGKVGG